MARNSNRLRTTVLIAVPLSLLLLTGALRPVFDPIVGLLAGAASRLYAAGTFVSTAVGRITAADARDRALLEQDVVTLRIENAKLRELAVENESLKLALSFREHEDEPLLLARVISETDDDVFHGIVIDRGSDDGVTAGQAVVVNDGIVVGKVFEAGRRLSSVLLLADSKSRLAVSVQNDADTIGVLAGDRGLSMAIDLIPQGETVANGDVIVTSGLEPGIRRGLIVGTVEKVSLRSQDPFQTATITPFAAAKRPIYVHVMTGAAVITERH